MASPATPVTGAVPCDMSVGVAYTATPLLPLGVIVGRPTTAAVTATDPPTAASAAAV
jgi:hypothetical protein